jgi:hypothetical protein
VTSLPNARNPNPTRGQLALGVSWGLVQLLFLGYLFLPAEYWTNPQTLLFLPVLLVGLFPLGMLGGLAWLLTRSKNQDDDGYSES